MFQISGNQYFTLQITELNFFYMRLYKNNCNIFFYEKILYFLCKDKKALYSSFYENEQFLNSGTFTYFTLFGSVFVDMSLDNYGQVETINLRALLFVVASDTVLIEYEIFNSEKETTKVAMLKLQLVYCVFSIQICLLSIRQILQSILKVEGNKSGSSFCDKSGNGIFLATSNLWNNIQIVRTHILKYNVPNLISLIRYLDFETLHHHFEHTSDKVIYHIFNNIENTKRIHFPTQKYVCCDCTLKIYQHSFPKNFIYSSKSLGLIYSNLLELSTLFYKKYK